jgi:hypothetical protein
MIVSRLCYTNAQPAAHFLANDTFGAAKAEVSSLHAVRWRPSTPMSATGVAPATCPSCDLSKMNRAARIAPTTQSNGKNLSLPARTPLLRFPLSPPKADPRREAANGEARNPGRVPPMAACQQPDENVFISCNDLVAGTLTSFPGKLQCQSSRPLFWSATCRWKQLLEVHGRCAPSVSALNAALLSRYKIPPSARSVELYFADRGEINDKLLLAIYPH